MARLGDARGEQRAGVAAARVAAETAWIRFAADGGTESLHDYYAAEAVVRRAYEEAIGGVLHLGRSVPARRTAARLAHPASA